MRSIEISRAFSLNDEPRYKLTLSHTDTEIGFMGRVVTYKHQYEMLTRIKEWLPNGTIHIRPVMSSSFEDKAEQ